MLGRTEAGGTTGASGAPEAGSTLWLHLPENQLHLFDGEQDNEYE